jgi:hypothetical protein
MQLREKADTLSPGVLFVSAFRRGVGDERTIRLGMRCSLSDLGPIYLSDFIRNFNYRHFYHFSVHFSILSFADGFSGLLFPEVVRACMHVSDILLLS